MKCAYCFLALGLLLCCGTCLHAQTEGRAATDTLHVLLPPIEVIRERYEHRAGCFAPRVEGNIIETQLSDYSPSYFMHAGTLSDMGVSANGVRQYHLQPEPHLWGTRMGTRDLLMFR